jgi:hypothetical protein
MELKMKVITGLALLVILSGSAFATKNKDHHHTSEALSLNHGKRWEADKVMKENMQAIHDKLKTTNELIKTNKIKQNDYLVLSDLISNSAQSIATNCKMEPKADATFHVILEDLFSITESLKDPKKTKDSINHLTHALKTYSKYFDQTF